MTVLSIMFALTACGEGVINPPYDNEYNPPHDDGGGSEEEYIAVKLKSIYLLDMPRTDNGQPWDMGFLEGAEPDLCFYIYNGSQLDYTTGYLEDVDISERPGIKINRTYKPNDILRIKAYDYDGATNNDYIGEVEFVLANYEGMSTATTSQGKVTISLTLDWY